MSEQTIAALEIPQPETLRQILETLSQADDALIQLSNDQMAQLGEQLAAKIDAYKYVEEKLKAEEARYAERIAEFSKAKRACVNTRERLKEVLAYHMKTKNYAKIPGNDYVATLTSSKAVKIKVGEPTAMDTVKYADFVRVSYEWNKAEITKALKAESPEAQEIAEFQESFSAKIDVKKERLLNG